MRILVTGGAGYIGSHAVRELIKSGHEVVVLDNLSRGHSEAVDARALLIEGDVGDADLLMSIFAEQSTDAVLHFAGDIEVAESVSNPGKYYQNNFANSMCLLEAMRRAGVQKIIFSSTAAVYGYPLQVPIDENQLRQPINPYGRSKMMTEMALEDCARAHGIGYAILRYFNAAGAHPDGTLGEDHHPETHLIPRAIQSALDGQTPLKIFGTDYETADGTCVRDYIHVVDLARAHVLALASLRPGDGRVYNLGSEKGFSIREVIRACEKVTGRSIPVIEEGRRAGDPATLVASSRKIREELKWTPQFADLETIVKHAWNWHSNHPRGYESKRTKNPLHGSLGSPAAARRINMEGNSVLHF